MASKTILVTGGCGFVGRHLVQSLLQKNSSVWIIDDLSIGIHPDSWLSKGFTKTISSNHKHLITYHYPKYTINFCYQDVIPFFYDQIHSITNEKLELPYFDEIYHLASIVGGRALIDGDPNKVATDLAIDAIFFLWVTRNPSKVGRLLYASSSAAYPIHLQTKEKHVALKEEYIQFNEKLGMPDMTYGWSKLTGEFLSQLTAKKYHIPVACVRPFSGYGEDQDLSYPTPAIADRIAKRENPVEVWGTGEQGRDFIQIDDAVEAMHLILQKVSDGTGINIGTGKVYSFNEIIRLYAEIAGYSPTIKPLLEKPVGVQSRYADITEMKKILAWEPKISLKEGLTRVLRYREQQLKKEKI